MRGSHPRLLATTARFVRATAALLVAATSAHGLAACGTYELPVVYAPEDGEKVRRPWRYVW